MESDSSKDFAVALTNFLKLIQSKLFSNSEISSAASSSSSSTSFITHKKSPRVSEHKKDFSYLPAIFVLKMFCSQTYRVVRASHIDQGRRSHFLAHVLQRPGLLHIYSDCHITEIDSTLRRTDSILNSNTPSTVSNRLTINQVIPLEYKC